MLLPIACINACILDRIAAVDHHPIAHIDAHMGSAGCIVGALEEYQITGLGICGRYCCTDMAKAVCTKSADVPSHAAVVEYP